MRRWLWVLGLCACDDGASSVDPTDLGPDSPIRDAAPDATVDAGAASDAAPLDADQPDASPPDAVVDPDMPVQCVDGVVEVTGSCGLNDRGEATRTCRDGAWADDPCMDPDTCIDGDVRAADCEDGDGTQTCGAGQWGAVDGCVEPPALCPPAIDVQVGAPWRGQLAGAGQWQSACGGDGAEITARFTAPAAATYRFSLGESDFDTVLSLRADCDDADSEILCNDDAIGNRSELSYAMAPGESVTVVVDAFFVAGGTFELQISEIVCEAGVEERRRCEEPGELPAEQTRFCRVDGWTEWTPCAVFGECVPGDVEVIQRRCEDNQPGEQQRQCDDEGMWSDWSACMPTGQCFSGATEWADCAVAGAQHMRTCGEDQMWGEWSDCVGATCPPLQMATLGTQRGQFAPIASALGNDCGDQGGTANTLGFTAGGAGTYAFWLQTSRPALSIRAGCDDAQSSLDCDTYRRTAFEFRPENASITLPLAADQTVALLAGSEQLPGRFGQGYALNIDYRNPDRCDDEPADNHHWSTAIAGDAVIDAFGGSIGLLSADQCAGQSDWFVADVPMGCNLIFSPLRTLHGRSAVGIRTPFGGITRDSGLLGPFSRIIGATSPGAYRVFIEPGMGDEPQTLVSTGIDCGRRVFHCGRGDDNIANNNPDAPAALVAPIALSEPICGGDVDHFEWVQGEGCHSRLTMACDLATLADLTVEFTDAEGAAIPEAQIRPEPGFGPLRAGWVVDRPPGSDLTRLRMQSDAMDANGRCDLRVEEVCFDQPCRGVGYALGDYGLFADTFCDDGATSLQAVDVAPGCTVRAARIGGDPVRFVVRQGDMIVAEGDESVEFEPDELGDVRIEVTGAPGARYILSGGVHCL